MTPKKEDYLKIIFELGGRKKKVSNKQIAMSLNVAAGSVTEMVSKLVKEGLVDHKLNYKLQDVHNDAEILEHVTSDNLMDHLEEFLGHPEHCPHGGVIPDKSGTYREESYLILADVAEGTTITVDRFIDNHELLSYLDDIHINLGDRLVVGEHTPFEGPIKLTYCDSGEETSIGYKAAHYIFVK